MTATHAVVPLLMQLPDQLPVPNPPAVPPPASGAITRILGMIKWFAGAAVAATFFGGLAAWTGGRIVDNHRYGRIGSTIMLVAVFGAVLYGASWPILDGFTAPS